MPFRAGTAHVVQFGSVGTEKLLLQLRQISAIAVKPAVAKTTSAASRLGRNVKTAARLTTMTSKFRPCVGR
jgi:hypothetical protein